jgi:hypothetical protein
MFGVGCFLEQFETMSDSIKRVGAWVDDESEPPAANNLHLIAAKTMMDLFQKGEKHS